MNDGGAKLGEALTARARTGYRYDRHLKSGETSYRCVPILYGAGWQLGR